MADSLPLSSHPDCNTECRACHYKHLDYPAQLARKQSWAEQQLGRWKPRLAPIAPAPEDARLGYRSKTWLRSSGSGDTLSFGMIRSKQEQGRWEKEFVSWDRCPLHAEPIRTMIARVKGTLGSSEATRSFAETSLAGLWFGSPHLVVVAFRDDASALSSVDWASVLSGPFDRVWFHAVNQLGPRVFGHRPLRQLAGPPPTAAHPVRAFRQVAHALLAQARGLALEHLLRNRPAQVLDLYCGTGELSLGLPPETGWIGIEMSREAVGFAARLRDPALALHRAFVGSVEHRLEDPEVLGLVRGPYALYLNPPRPGLSPAARERLAALLERERPGEIAYLSCSASSLARDLGFLEQAGYRVESLRPFDFFPQTEHFETLATLSPAAPGA